MEIKNSKVRETFPISQLPRKRFVDQTWSLETPLRQADYYRSYDPGRVRFTPKWDNDGLGKTAVVDKGAYFLLSQ